MTERDDMGLPRRDLERLYEGQRKAASLGVMRNWRLP